MTTTKACKDCLAEWVASPEADGPVARARPAPHPGPRCATHHRAKKRADRLAAHSRRLETVYSITRADYDAIVQAQGGVCAICQRATGATKRLAVDHDHACCSGPTSCGRCVRGALCGPCNDVLGHFRDDPKAGTRLTLYLIDPPAQRLRRTTTATATATKETHQ